MATPNNPHSFRRLLVLALVAGIVVAVRNAVADKGGTYDPAEAGL